MIPIHHLNYEFGGFESQYKLNLMYIYSKNWSSIRQTQNVESGVRAEIWSHGMTIRTDLEKDDLNISVL